jgi:TonB family protein
MRESHRAVDHLSLAFAALSRHTNESASLAQELRVPCMSHLKTILPKTDRAFPSPTRPRAPEDPTQRKLMIGSLCLLLLALGIVLWHERDFWFSDTPEAGSTQPIESVPVAKLAPVQTSAAGAQRTRAAKPRRALNHAQNKAVQNQAVQDQVAQDLAAQNLAAQNQAAPEATSPAEQTPPPVSVSARTVLPPLEVEVVAGDTHRTIRPGSSSVRVDLQPGATSQPAPDAAADSETAANITSEAAERVQMSADASQIVADPVRPSYPLLARQMKVQGSVILQALIGRDGIIQNLRVVSGPHILASAAQNAVMQWHFKPHFEGSEAVETQAKITVNFTISTN